jgi:hypothetical protein
MRLAIVVVVVVVEYVYISHFAQRHFTLAMLVFFEGAALTFAVIWIDWLLRRKAALQTFLAIYFCFTAAEIWIWRGSKSAMFVCAAAGLACIANALNRLVPDRRQPRKGEGTT